jgi:hypothetical protein
MMKKIRYGVFETNSSSTHSLSIMSSNRLNEDNLDYFVDECDLKIHIDLEDCEFGWEIKDYTMAIDKLRYAIMMVIETECKDCKSVSDVMETSGFNEIEDLIISKVKGCKGIEIENHGIERSEYEDYDGNKKHYLKHNGYIDHQSVQPMKNILDFYGVSLEDFIFNMNIVLHTDNDNHD